MHSIPPPCYVAGSPEWHVKTRSDGTSRRSAPPRRLRVMRVVTAAEAVAVIRSGAQIYLHCAAGTPSVRLDALVARAEELHDVLLVHLHIAGPGPHLAP